jgi:hypothetical protein
LLLLLLLLQGLRRVIPIFGKQVLQTQNMTVHEHMSALAWG